MKNEKTRGTMLTSSAVILCLVTFAAGFVGFPRAGKEV